MRKLSVLIVVLMIVLGAKAEGDTLTVVRPNVVTITKEYGQLGVEIIDEKGQRLDVDSVFESMEVSEELEVEDSLDLRGLHKKHREDRKVENNIVDFEIGAGLRLGFIYPEGSGNYADYDQRGWEIWLPEVVNLEYYNKKSHLGIRFDVGLLWRHYLSPKDKCFTMDNGVVLFDLDYPAGSTPKRSQINVYSTTFSLSAMWKPTKHTEFCLGPVLNINNGQNVRTRYTDNNKHVITKWEDPKVRTVTFDWVVSLDWHGIGVYYKYSPKALFKEQYGPMFTSNTVGLNLFF